MASVSIVIDGKRYLWRDILKFRREQRKAARQHQLTPFELKTVVRLLSGQQKGRFTEPTLFRVD